MFYFLADFAGSDVFIDSVLEISILALVLQIQHIYSLLKEPLVFEMS